MARAGHQNLLPPGEISVRPYHNICAGVTSCLYFDMHKRPANRAAAWRTSSICQSVKKGTTKMGGYTSIFVCKLEIHGPVGHEYKKRHSNH